MKLLSCLVILAIMDTCSSQCRKANWQKAFDKKGWVKCDSSDEYLTGFYRKKNLGSKDYIHLLEEGRCCKALSPNENQPSSCTKANWLGVLDRSVTNDSLTSNELYIISSVLYSPNLQKVNDFIILLWCASLTLTADFKLNVGAYKPLRTKQQMSDFK